jgi:flagellar protein FlaG
LTAEQVEQMVKEVKQVVEQVAQNLRFSVDESTGRTVITVTDAATKEVIRQIPSEEMLAVARALGRLQGLLLRKEA